MKQNKVLEFAARQTSKSWINFQITQMRPSLDPNQPELYLMDVQGQRGDGVVFTIPVAIERSKFDLLPMPKAVSVMQGILQGSIKRLMTFTGCGCTADTECEQHKIGPVN